MPFIIFDFFFIMETIMEILAKARELYFLFIERLKVFFPGFDWRDLIRSAIDSFLFGFLTAFIALLEAVNYGGMELSKDFLISTTIGLFNAAGRTMFRSIMDVLRHNISMAVRRYVASKNPVDNSTGLNEGIAQQDADI